MLIYPYLARVFSHDLSDFRGVTNTKVLIYWPHGFGDWVMLSYLLPLLEPSNQYYVTRFGDDYVSLMEDNPYATPVYLGTSSPHCDDGAHFGIHHFNIHATDGSINDLSFPAALYEFCHSHGIDTVLYSGFPETGGLQPYPFQSKPRYLIPHLIAGGGPSLSLLEQPLATSLSFAVSPWLTRYVEARVQSYLGQTGRRLCLIGRTGYTAHGKNWGHLFREEAGPTPLSEGEECRDFMRLLLRKDPSWVFLSMEDKVYEGNDTLRSPELHSFSYAEIFGAGQGLALPYGLVMKVLMNMASLFVGVPSGPYCLAMAKNALPTVGLWIEHYPSWYVEPSPAAVHVISQNVRDLGYDRRPGSFVMRGGLHYNMLPVDTRRITGEQALAAVEMVL